MRIIGAVCGQVQIREVDEAAAVRLRVPTRKGVAGPLGIRFGSRDRIHDGEAGGGFIHIVHLRRVVVDESRCVFLHLPNGVIRHVAGKVFIIDGEQVVRRNDALVAGLRRGVCGPAHQAVAGVSARLGHALARRGHDVSVTDVVARLFELEYLRVAVAHLQIEGDDARIDGAVRRGEGGILRRDRPGGEVYRVAGDVAPLAEGVDRLARAGVDVVADGVFGQLVCGDGARIRRLDRHGRAAVGELALAGVKGDGVLAGIPLRVEGDVCGRRVREGDGLAAAVRLRVPVLEGIPRQDGIGGFFDGAPLLIDINRAGRGGIVVEVERDGPFVRRASRPGRRTCRERTAEQHCRGGRKRQDTQSVFMFRHIRFSF